MSEVYINGEHVHVSLEQLRAIDELAAERNTTREEAAAAYLRPKTPKKKDEGKEE